MQSDEFDMLLRPTSYSLFNGRLHEYAKLSNALLKNKDVVGEKLTTIEKFNFNKFLVHQYLAEEMLKLAHMEENLKQDLEAKEPLTSPQANEAFSQISSTITAIVKKLGAQKSLISKTLLKNIMALMATYEQANKVSELHCKPIIEDIFKQLRLLCIEPCIWAAYNLIRKEELLSIISHFKKDESEAVQQTLYTLNKQSKFMVNYFAWGLYIGILHAKVDDAVLKSQDLTLFLQNYTQHYNTLDGISRLIMKNADSPLVKQTEKSVQIGSKISATRLNDYDYTSLTVCDITYELVNGKTQKVK